MKQNTFFKSSRGLLLIGGMLGALLPLSAAHALDLLDRVHDDQLSQFRPAVTQDSTSASMQNNEEQMINTNPPAAGAQGPMRSDQTSDRAMENDRDRQNRIDREIAAKKDLERRLSPISGSNSP